MSHMSAEPQRVLSMMHKASHVQRAAPDTAFNTPFDALNSST